MVYMSLSELANCLKLVNCDTEIASAHNIGSLVSQSAN